MPSARCPPREAPLRDDPPPPETTLVVRGGPFDLAGLLAQVEDAAKVFQVGDRPLRGFSVEGVTDDWPLDRILREGRVHRATYATCTVGQLSALDCEVLATFGADPPHFTVMLPPNTAEVLESIVEFLNERSRPNPNQTQRDQR